MFYFLPISNLIIENPMKMADCYLLPMEFNARFDEFEFDSAITADDRKIIDELTDIAYEHYQHDIRVTTTALFPFQYSNISSCKDVPLDDFKLAEAIFDHVDRYLDYFRLLECQIGNLDSLPSLPGVILDSRAKNSFTRYLYQIDEKERICREVLSPVEYYHSNGIGLYSDVYCPSEQHPILYDCLFSNRKDEVYNRCRTALTRINEAMYMRDVSVAFVYIMSTIEMLTSNTMLNFRKTKSLFLPFISSNKKEYYQLSDEFRTLTQYYRTEVVHNGKKLYELDGLDTYKKIIKFIMSWVSNILLYCESVIQSGVTSYNEVNLLATKKAIELGIKPDTENQS